MKYNLKISSKVCFLALVMILLAVGVQNAAAQHGVHPAQIELEIGKGRSVMSEVELRSTEKEPKEVKIFIARAIPQLDGSYNAQEFIGSYEHNPDTEPVVTLLTDDVVVIDSSEPRRIPFKVKMPRKVIGDEHLYYILFATETVRPVEGANAEIKFVQRVGVTLILHTAGKRPVSKAQVLDLSHEIKDGLLFLNLHVKSAGNRGVNVGGRLKLYDLDSGALVTTLPLIPTDVTMPHVLRKETIFAGYERRFSVPVQRSLKAGEYRVVALMDVEPGARSMLRKQATFALEEAVEVSSEEIANYLTFEKPAIDEIVPQGKQKIISHLVRNNFFEEIILRLSSDNSNITTGSLPVRIAPGEEKQLKIVAENPEGVSYDAVLQIQLEDSGQVIEVPIKVSAN